jgi:hypothetical protein
MPTSECITADTSRDYKNPHRETEYADTHKQHPINGSSSMPTICYTERIGEDAYSFLIWQHDNRWRQEVVY